MMPIFKQNIQNESIANTNYRKVLYTGTHLQLVVMSLNPKETIDEEVHSHTDQFFRIEEGVAQFKIEDQTFDVVSEDAIIVPAGSKHSVQNTSDTQVLKLYTIYTPPNHPEGTIHISKQDADAAEAEHHQ